MGKLFMICALMLMVAHLCSAQNDLDEVMADTDDDSTVKSESSTTVDGKQVREKSVGDKECRMHVTRIEYEDKTVDAVVDDLEDETGLVLFSDSPTTCFVRHMDKPKEKCQNGYAVPDEGESNNDNATGSEDATGNADDATDNADDATGNEDDTPESESETKKTEETVKVTTLAETSYKEGEAISIDLLPEKLQKLCAGRKIIKMVETQESETDGATDTTEDDSAAEQDETGVRKKRWAGQWSSCWYVDVMRCRLVSECRRSCYRAWLWGRRCCRTRCYRYNVCYKRKHRICHCSYVRYVDYYYGRYRYGK